MNPGVGIFQLRDHFILDYYSSKLNGYLADIDKQAEEMLFWLVKQMAERECVTENLKADNQMEWVGQDKVQ